MNILFYSKQSENAIFIWPSLAVNFVGGFWVELAWLSWAVGCCGVEQA